MAKCEDCGKEMGRKKRLLVGVNSRRVCQRCYGKYDIYEQLGLQKTKISERPGD